MPKKLKDFYDGTCAELLGKKIQKQYPEFDLHRFIEFIDSNIEDKPFLKRQDLFVDGFERFMTGLYEEDIGIFFKILGPELKQAEGMFTEGWWLWPLGRYVERHGLENRPLSMDFIYELTKRHTGEFAIRPLLNENPRETLEVMLSWSKDNNVHVRRLASEGMRIRLPWAKKCRAVLEEPELFRMILDNLKEDSEKFVMKSVGNNLNDLMKENPEMAESIILDWRKNHLDKSTEWIIKHGERSKKL